MLSFFDMAALVIDDVLPGSAILSPFTAAVAQINFYDTMMNGMLAFLLFAGALHVDLAKLRTEAVPVALLGIHPARAAGWLL